MSGYAHWLADRRTGNTKCQPYLQHWGFLCAPAQLDIALAVSRTGDNFSWPAGREALLSPSLTGTFASRVVGTVQGIVEAPGGEELWLYYYGDNIDNSGRLGPEATQRDTSIGRARFRMSGLTFLRVPLFQPASAGQPARPWPDGGCHVITKPLQYSGRQLVLNVDTGAVGSIAVAIEPLAGDRANATRFGLERSVQMTTNSVRAVAAWWSSAEPDAGQVEDVSGLGGQAVRLHFVMVAARLYSYRFV